MYTPFETINSWNQPVQVAEEQYGDETVMAVWADNETIYITKEQAMAFFGLADKPAPVEIPLSGWNR